MKNGGPAFPEWSVVIPPRERMQIEPITTHSTGGMSLRDYLAARMMPTVEERALLNENEWMVYALAAYRAADAMLVAREKQS